MTKRRRNRSSSEAGFTLIETLIAMTLMVGILAALAAVTSQWLPNWNRGFARVQRTEVLGRGLERLVADLSAAEFVTANAKAKLPMFDGNELSVMLVRSAIGPNTRPGLEVIRIAWVSDAQGAALVRTRLPFVMLPVDGKITDLSNFTDPVVLMRAPYRAVFSYAGRDGLWRNNWREAEQLPAAIRVSVRDAGTERTLAVSTATLLHVNLQAECARAKTVRECVYPPPKSERDG